MSRHCGVGDDHYSWWITRNSRRRDPCRNIRLLLGVTSWSDVRRPNLRCHVFRSPSPILSDPWGIEVGLVEDLPGSSRRRSSFSIRFHIATWNTSTCPSVSGDVCFRLNCRLSTCDSKMSTVDFNMLTVYGMHWTT